MYVINFGPLAYPLAEIAEIDHTTVERKINRFLLRSCSSCKVFKLARRHPKGVLFGNLDWGGFPFVSSLLTQWTQWKWKWISAWLQSVLWNQQRQTGGSWSQSGDYLQADISVLNQSPKLHGGSRATWWLKSGPQTCTGFLAEGGKEETRALTPERP